MLAHVMVRQFDSESAMLATSTFPVSRCHSLPVKARNLGLAPGREFLCLDGEREMKPARQVVRARCGCRHFNGLRGRLPCNHAAERFEVGRHFHDLQALKIARQLCNRCRDHELGQYQQDTDRRLIWGFCRWPESDYFRNLSVAIDGELVVSSSKLLAIGLDNDPS